MERESWIETVLLPLAAALLVTLWLTLWLRWLLRFSADLNASLTPHLPALGLLAFILIAAWAARRVINSAMPLDWARLAVAGLGLLGAAALARLSFGSHFPFGYLRGLFDWGAFISAEFIFMIALGYAWWRGVLIGQSRIPYDDLAQAFYRGIIALAVLFGVNRLFPLLASDEAFPTELSFFATGLAALALASFQRSRRQQYEADSGSLAISRYWLGTVAGLIGLVLLGGIAVTGLTAPEMLGRLRPLFMVFDPLAQLLLTLLGFLLILIAVPLFSVLEWLVRLSIDMIRLPQLPENLRFGEEAAEMVDAILNSPVVQATSRGVSMFLILGLFLMLIWMAVRRLIVWPAVEVEETRENIMSSELVLDQLKGWFARRRRPAAAVMPPYLPLPGPPDDPRLMVRRAYQGMLELARLRGSPRLAGQTPVQYAATLARALPQGQQAIALLTDTYLLARYAADAPSLEDARRAESALAKLNEQLPQAGGR